MRFVFVATLLISLTAWGQQQPRASFDQALDAIVERSTNITAQQANLGAQRARNVPIRLAFLPSVSLDGARTTTKPEGVSPTTGQSAQGTARLNLFRFGADVSNWRAATSDELAQASLLDAEVLRAERNGVEALLNQIQNQLEVEVLKRIVESQTGLYRITRERYARGLTPLQETQKIEVDLENAEARARDAEIQLHQSTATLAMALGHANIELQWPWDERFEHLDVQGLVSRKLNLEQVPAFRSARHQAEAEDRRVARNFSQIFPTLDGSFAYGYTKPTPGVSWQQGWTGVLSVSVPLFDRLTNISNYREQAFTRTRAEAQLEQARRDASAEYEASSKAFEIALRSALSRNRTLKLSRSLYQDDLRRFRAGRVNANDFFVDQNRLFTSELQAIRGWSAAHLAFVRYCHSLGMRAAHCLPR